MTVPEQMLKKMLEEHHHKWWEMRQAWLQSDRGTGYLRITVRTGDVA